LLVKRVASTKSSLTAWAPGGDSYYRVVYYYVVYVSTVGGMNQESRRPRHPLLVIPILLPPMPLEPRQHPGLERPLFCRLHILPHVRWPPHPGDDGRNRWCRQTKPQRQLRQRPHLLIQQPGQRLPPPLGLGTTVPGEVALPPVTRRKYGGGRDPPGERTL